MEQAGGWSAREVLRLEEIRQLVETERPLLPASRATALEYKEFLRTRDVLCALPISPREKSDDAISEDSNSAPVQNIPVDATAAAPVPTLQESVDRIREIVKDSPVARSAGKTRKIAAKVRRGRAPRRRRRGGKK